MNRAAPCGAAGAPQPANVEPAIVRVCARGWRWISVSQPMSVCTCRRPSAVGTTACAQTSVPRGSAATCAAPSRASIYASAGAGVAALRLL